MKAIYNEGDVSKLLRAEFENLGVHVEQIESHTSSAGIPDLDGCCDGQQFKVELKFISGKKKKAEIRSTQKRWFRERIEAGYSPWGLLYHQTADGAATWILIKGEDFVKLPNASTLEDWQKATFKTWGPGPVDYDSILSFVTL